MRSGHSNLNTTRIYITPSEQDLEGAAEVSDLFLRLVYGAVADELRLASGMKFTTK